jgi:protein TonB
MPITAKDDSSLEAQDAPPVPRTDVRQRRRMLLALAVLLMAVVIVFVKDRESWNISGSAGDSENSQSAVVAPPGPVPTVPAAEMPAPTAATPAATATSKKRLTPPPSSAKAIAPAGPMISATDRAVLPPLDVEVVAGNQRKPLAASSSSVKVEMQPSALAANGPAAAPEANQPVNAEAHVSLSQDTTARVTRTVEPSYPLLAKQMKVQGAVVLQALIDKTGNIEDLHVVSGPTILAAAAREAVKQWHFKPYFQSGQAVETEARITVNFTISTY